MTRRKRQPITPHQRVRWTDEKLNLLGTIVADPNGPKKWPDIAVLFKKKYIESYGESNEPFPNGKQCNEKWRKALDGSVKHHMHPAQKEVFYNFLRENPVYVLTKPKQWAALSRVFSIDGVKFDDNCLKNTYHLNKELKAELEGGYDASAFQEDEAYSPEMTERVEGDSGSSHSLLTKRSHEDDAGDDIREPKRTCRAPDESSALPSSGTSRHTLFGVPPDASLYCYETFIDYGAGAVPLPAYTPPVAWDGLNASEFPLDIPDNDDDLHHLDRAPEGVAEGLEEFMRQPIPEGYAAAEAEETAAAAVYQP